MIPGSAGTVACAPRLSTSPYTTRPERHPNAQRDIFKAPEVAGHRRHCLHQMGIEASQQSTALVLFEFDLGHAMC